MRSSTAKKMFSLTTGAVCVLSTYIYIYVQVYQNIQDLSSYICQKIYIYVKVYQNIQDLFRCLAGTLETWWVEKPSELLPWHAGSNQGGSLAIIVVIIIIIIFWNEGKGEMEERGK